MTTAGDQLIALNAEYKEITGEDWYLYTSRPGDGRVHVAFVSGVRIGEGPGLAHMVDALERVKQGHSHNPMWQG